MSGLHDGDAVTFVSYPLGRGTVLVQTVVRTPCPDPYVGVDEKLLPLTEEGLVWIRGHYDENTQQGAALLAAAAMRA